MGIHRFLDVSAELRSAMSPAPQPRGAREVERRASALRRARGGAAVAGVVLVLTAVAIAFLPAGGPGGSSGRPASPAATGGAAPSREEAAAAVRSAAMPGTPEVAYSGPRGVLSGQVLLRAQARSARARVVAVTFMLDGRPLGSDTTAPFTLDLDASLLPPGPHRLTVQAVDRLGGRAETPPLDVRTAGRPRGVLTASPTHGLANALARLARGHVTVRLAPGRYAPRTVHLGSGARLVGSGPGTVLTGAGAGAGGGAAVAVGGTGVRVSDLHIDGGGRGVVVGGGSHDVRLQRLSIRGVSTHGVEVWGAHSGISVQDSRIVGRAAYGAGVFERGSDQSRDMSVIRTAIRGFRGYGINFVQQPHGRPAAALHGLALDNRIADIDDPAADDGTHEGGIWSGGVAAVIVGNHIRRTGIDGIETVGSSTRVTIVDNDVAETPVGIYLERETNDSLIARNRISDVRTGINVEWRHGGAGSNRNTLAGNHIVGPRQTGIFVDVAGDRNRIARNVVEGGAGPVVVLQGASDNVVVDNRGCARPGEPIVREQSARFDDGRPARSLRNRFLGNASVASCEAG